MSQRPSRQTESQTYLLLKIPHGQFLHTYEQGNYFASKSITYPGTTSDVIRPILEESNLTAGKEFFLAYSPEREDPGNKNFSTDSIPKLVGGYSSDCTEIAVAFYNLALSHIVPVRSCAVAEAAKLLENIYRSVNIALVNELKALLTRMDIDIWEVIDVAKNKTLWVFSVLSRTRARRTLYSY